MTGLDQLRYSLLRERAVRTLCMFAILGGQNACVPADSGLMLSQHLSLVAAFEEQSETQGFSPAQQFEIVDCLLPGQIRSVGGRVYQTPRRPTRTTVADCKMRGGEFKVYDRANYTASLNVWLPMANRGDAEAQTYVGMLYERGVDASPDYDQAVSWYRKAAEQGYDEAKYYLGTMYERGLGVEQDIEAAFNWYRKAQGVSEDNLVYQSSMDQAIRDQRRELESALRESAERIDVLVRQIERLREDAASSQTEISTLESIVADLQSRQTAAKTRFARLPKVAPAPIEPEPPIAAIEFAESVENGDLDDEDFGKYYAMIVGVQNYGSMPKLPTAINDAERAEQILRDRYGFLVTRLDNPSQFNFMETIARYSGQLTSEDNLLIFFAGPGEILSSGPQEHGYWLPTDADAPPNYARWIENDNVTGHINRTKALRVLVVSDSIYEGLLDRRRGLSAGIDGVSSGYLDITLPKRARLLLASGAKQPIPGDDGKHSRFSSAFLDELEANRTILHTPALFKRIVDRLSADAPNTDFQPMFREIRSARHQQGDFFFVPKPGG